MLTTTIDETGTTQVDALRNALQGVALLGFDTADWSGSSRHGGAKPAFVGIPVGSQTTTKQFSYILTSTNNPNNPNEYTINQPYGNNYFVADSTSDDTDPNDNTIGNKENDEFVAFGNDPGGFTYNYIGKTSDNSGLAGNADGPTILFTDTPYQPGDTVTLSSDPYVVCYCTGTLIRTDSGDVAVEKLRIGDRVVTASGVHRPIKWIGTRSYAPRFANANPALLPVLFKAGSLADGIPARDLRVSPKHAMMLDGVLIPAEHLVNGASIVKETRVEELNYFHVELDSHDVLIAEGAESESFVDDNGRDIFHNADSFRELYPDTRREEAVYCAPRVESGYVLQAVRQRLAERTGASAAAVRSPGALRGKVDGCDGVRIWGWAQSEAFPDAPVCLEVSVDGRAVALVYADRHRGDLASAGIGDGRHAFTLTLPAPLSAEASHTVAVRRASDGAALAGVAGVAARLRDAA